VNSEKKLEQTSNCVTLTLRTQRLTALIPEMDCDQTAMGLQPITSAVFLTLTLTLTAKSFLIPFIALIKA
jgi:hypothetical protein